MTAPAIEDAAKVLADPMAYTDEVRLHAVLAQLRADAPVVYVDAPGYRPFWAITRHADILAIERENDLFINAPRPVLMSTAINDSVESTWAVEQMYQSIAPVWRLLGHGGNLALRYRPVPTEVGSLQANGIAHMKDSLWSLDIFDVNRKKALAWAGKKSD